MSVVSLSSACVKATSELSDSLIAKTIGILTWVPGLSDVTLKVDLLCRDRVGAQKTSLA
jgi:hypothetical protein